MSSISEEEDSGPSLKELVTKNLEANGILGKLQAQLRASIFLILEEEFKEKNIPLINERSQNLLSSPVGKIATSLIQDFLQCLNLEFTLAVFCPETKTALVDKSTNRQRLQSLLGKKNIDFKGQPVSFNEDSNSNYPLLFYIIEECQNQINTCRDEATLPQSNRATNGSLEEASSLNGEVVKASNHEAVRPPPSTHVQKEMSQPSSQAVRDNGSNAVQSASKPLLDQGPAIDTNVAQPTQPRPQPHSLVSSASLAEAEVTHGSEAKDSQSSISTSLSEKETHSEKENEYSDDLSSLSDGRSLVEDKDKTENTKDEEQNTNKDKGKDDTKSNKDNGKEEKEEEEDKEGTASETNTINGKQVADNFKDKGSEKAGTKTVNRKEEEEDKLKKENSETDVTEDIAEELSFDDILSSNSEVSNQTKDFTPSKESIVIDYEESL